ncbi:hypothetical protein BRD00_08210 [Halobacteriales archaeon QS_8_69_26]|nr:MAG: hypothetical protein BRD00_08210 [Halobacteriales archaeon QS_8_69_26]
MTEDFYDLLGVDPDAPQDAIRRAYRRQVREYHPDLNDDPRAPAQFTALQEAYETLGNPKERDAYERLGHDEYVRKRISGLPSPDRWDIPDRNGAPTGEQPSDDAGEETSGDGTGTGSDGAGSTGADEEAGAAGGTVDPAGGRRNRSSSGLGPSDGGSDSSARSGSGTGPQSSGSRHGSQSSGSPGGSRSSGRDSGSANSRSGSSGSGANVGRTAGSSGSEEGSGSSRDPGTGWSTSWSDTSDSSDLWGPHPEEEEGDGRTTAAGSDRSMGSEGSGTGSEGSGTGSVGSTGSNRSPPNGPGRSTTGTGGGPESSGSGRAGGRRSGSGGSSTTSDDSGSNTGTGQSASASGAATRRADSGSDAWGTNSSGTARSGGTAAAGTGAPTGGGTHRDALARLREDYVDSLRERLGEVGLGWPLILLTDALYLFGLLSYLTDNADGVDRFVDRLLADGLGPALANSHGIEPLTTWVSMEISTGNALAGVLLVAGAAALPPVYVTIVRETRANRTPWRPSYLYAVGALGPVAGMVLNPLVGAGGLSLDAIAYVVLPVGAVVGLPVSAFVLPRMKRFVRRIRWRLSS